jgi:p-aminobenzoyl-glutamate transporter AbgT
MQYTYVSIIASIVKKQHPDSKIGLTMATIVTVAITTIADPLLTRCWCMLPLPLLLLPLFLCGFVGWVGDS